jgi:hypothetical protein
MKPRHRPIFVAAIFLIALAAGCASYSGAGLVPGQSSVEDVKAAMGEPTLVRELPDGDEVLWYSKLPNGRESYAAHIGRDGTLVSIEQRLTAQHIAKLRPNESTGEDVLDILGPPYRRFKFPLKDRESWEYPLWTSPDKQTLYVELSPDNVVRAVYQLHDRDTRFRFF